jgi:hypothetical protein
MDYIISPAEFDVSKVTYGEPKDIGATGGRMIYLSYNKSPITIQTPEMIAPYTMKDWEGNHNYTLDLSFKGKEARENLKTFYDKLVEFDEKLINDGIANGLTWIRKKINSKEIAETIYTKMVRYSKDKNTGEVTDKFPATIKLKVPYKEGKFVCETYNGAKELIDLVGLETKGARITAIIQCLGIWVAGGKYGVSWKVLLMKVLPPPTIKGYLFKDDEETVKEVDLDDEDNDDVDDELTKEINGKMKDTKVIESSDDEVEDSEDELEEKKPEVIVKAKATRGKK